jgi:hypothetical protein
VSWRSAECVITSYHLPQFRGRHITSSCDVIIDGNHRTFCCVVKIREASCGSGGPRSYSDDDDDDDDGYHFII